MQGRYDVAVVGGGFAGLSAAMTAARGGAKVVLLEAEHSLGGLGGTFAFEDGVEVEKFYHHWFTNDVFVPRVVDELGMTGDVVTMPSRTGMYLNGRIWSLSTPLDLLRFTALPLSDRIRLGLSTLRVRKVQDWHAIEHLTIREWLEPLCGKRAYERVWEPLVRSKFGKYADEITAVWMWKKLVLRGSTRGSAGQEQLAYFKGGFGRLAAAIGADVGKNGGEVRLGEAVLGVETDGDRVTGLRTSRGTVEADRYVFTPSLSIVADVFDEVVPPEWLASLRRVAYLGNICLVLRLTRSLSDTYWLNVNDPGFPFVGVIEHTNFEPPESYGGRHIVFLSKYLPESDALYQMADEDVLGFAVPHLQRMFPDFKREWVTNHHVWRARFSQPIAEPHYSRLLPAEQTPLDNVLITSMAQIYPEDRGTNYAIREGRRVAREMVAVMPAEASAKAEPVAG